MSTPSRRNRRLDRPRERVLEAAWELVIERGLAELTLAELGRRVETSASHLLYYFGSKDELLLDVLRWSESQLAVERAAVMASENSVSDKLEGLVNLYVPTGPADPRWLLWIEMWPRALRVEGLARSQAALDHEWRPDFTALLDEAGVHEPELVMRRIVALLDGLSVAIMTGEDAIDVSLVWRHVAALVPELAPTH
ncbi:TetR/AcrR family transcriptional regulator [Nocardioides eburneiflavus]|uniref:TetR/AcrR family transcriptional regulator n=1 Tax=Nocardioides eburneiflavus TaxID=2518372 RepID=UPI001FEB2052|nr:TetR/AcrR family transcriptional regulator [Nocardioides eburneiflavus]